MGMTISSCLAAVKSYVPTTTMDQDIIDSINEMTNYLLSIELWPFAEARATLNISAGKYLKAMSCFNANLATIKNMVIETSGYQKNITYLQGKVFDEIYPNPSILSPSSPTFWKYDIAGTGVVFNCPTNQTYTGRVDYWGIPNNIHSSASFGSLSELAKMCVARMAAADTFNAMSQYDRGDKQDAIAQDFLKTLRRRYAMEREQDMRFLSPKTVNNLKRRNYRA
jgi:hypothetical protein